MLVIIVVKTVSKETGSGKGYAVHALLKDATGLAPHSRVTIAGIPVGTLKDITLEGGEARVNVQVERRHPALRERDDREEERVAPRREHPRPHPRHGRPAEAPRR